MNIKFLIIIFLLVLVWFSLDRQEGFFIGQGTGPTATCGTRFGSKFCA